MFEKSPSGRARLLPSLNDSGSATLPNGSAGASPYRWATFQTRSKSVARAAEAARNQGDSEGFRRTNYEGQADRGVQRPEERPEARPGVGFVHSSPWQDARLEASEGTNRLTKHAPATRGRKHDGATLANLLAGDTQRVSLKEPGAGKSHAGICEGCRATGVLTSTSLF